LTAAAGATAAAAAGGATDVADDAGVSGATTHSGSALICSVSMLYLMCSHYDILHDIQHMLILYDVELVVLNNTLEIQSMYIFKACVQTSICKSNIQCVIVVVVFAILTYMYTGYCWFDHAYVGFPKRGHRTDLVQYLVMFRCIIYIYT
jgi:hypothetical protein